MNIKVGRLTGYVQTQTEDLQASRLHPAAGSVCYCRGAASLKLSCQAGSSLPFQPSLVFHASWHAQLDTHSTSLILTCMSVVLQELVRMGKEFLAGGTPEDIDI
jgi:hypothetical protein